MNITVYSTLIDQAKHRLSFWATLTPSGVKISRGRMISVFPSVTALRYMTEELHRGQGGFPIDFMVFVNAVNIENSRSLPGKQLYLCYYRRQNTGFEARNNAYYRLKYVFRVETDFIYRVQNTRIQNHYNQLDDNESMITGVTLSFISADAPDTPLVFEINDLLELGQPLTHPRVIEYKKPLMKKLVQNTTGFVKSLFPWKK